MATVRLPIKSDLKAINGLLFREFPTRDGDFFDPQAFPAIAAAGDKAPFATSVAVNDDEVVGVAVSMPFPVPGGEGFDRRAVLLNFVTVAENFRRTGIGMQLLKDQERGFLTRGLRVAIAHVPSDLGPFYRAAGWEVSEPGVGFAWQYASSSSPLIADIPDGDQYNCLATRILGPSKLAYTFEFGIRSRKPILDAARQLGKLIDEDKTFARLVSPLAARQVDLSRTATAEAPATSRRGAFGQWVG